MVVSSKLLTGGCFLLMAPSGVIAVPVATKIEAIKHLLGRDNFEWTALGDSYSSGVGAGDYVSNSYRCLRYSSAYPSLMNGDARLPAGEHTWHDAVCSGSDSADIEAYQFYDQDTFAEPNRQYGDRPRFGSPDMASLSVGGNNIDFPGIIFNCIIETHLPFGAGPPQRTCDEQRKVTSDLLNSPALVDQIDQVIKKTVDQGRKGPIGDQFRLYLTGYPQFFSVETAECDNVTFARTANPKPDGKEHVLMTQALRREFNSMSVKLNEAIAAAVQRNSDQGVTWVPIDGVMDTHRFCEPGIHEPDQKNPNLWIFHYPYDEPQDDAIDGPLLNAYNKITANGTNVNPTYPTYNSFHNALLDAVELPGNGTENGAFDWFWKPIGYRVKVLHPQVPLHEKIRDLVLDQYVKDLSASGTITVPGTPDKIPCQNASLANSLTSRDPAAITARPGCFQTFETSKK